MKLIDWAISNALQSGDWIAAVNCVAGLFELPRFTPDCESIRGMIIHNTGCGLEEIRIGLKGKLYLWQPGILRARKTAVFGPWITIWTSRAD